jgi:hypothetical protein
MKLQAKQRLLKQAVHAKYVAEFVSSLDNGKHLVVHVYDPSRDDDSYIGIDLHILKNDKAYAECDLKDKEAQKEWVHDKDQILDLACDQLPDNIGVPLAEPDYRRHITIKQVVLSKKKRL